MASDNVIYFLMIYLLLGGFFFGLMPDSFFTGTVATFDDVENPNFVISAVSFPVKVATFLFVGLAIDGLPTVLAGILNIFNIMSIVFVTVWGVNKVRGVSS